MSEHVLVLGTHNHKKRLELEQLLASLGLQLKTLADFEDAIEVDETGTTFAENAALKASEQARNLGMWVMGEDSGISVGSVSLRTNSATLIVTSPLAKLADNVFVSNLTKLLAISFNEP